MDIGKRLSKDVGNTFGKSPVGGSTDQFHETGGGGGIVDSGRPLGNSLRRHVRNEAVTDWNS